MEFRSFDQIFQHAKETKVRKQLVVVAAESDHVLEAVTLAYNQGAIQPILVGDKKEIQRILKKLGAEHLNFEIISTNSKVESAQKAIDIINSGRGSSLMKGQIETSTILRTLFKKENGMRESPLASCLTICELESYHKILILTDAAINMYPNLEQKKLIIENAVNTMIKMGWECPKVGVLAATETVNEKMPESVDAYKLKSMNEQNIISNCIVEGPISLDIALNKESAEIKGFKSPVAGEADLLLYPDITAANIGSKTFGLSKRNKRATFVIGFKVPFILTSRGTSTEEKLRSILLSTVLN